MDDNNMNRSVSVSAPGRESATSGRWLDVAPEVSARMVELAHLAPGAAVLDAGTGNGEPALTVAQMVPSAIVIGVDISEESLALRGATRRGSRYHQRIFHQARCQSASDGHALRRHPFSLRSHGYSRPHCIACDPTGFAQATRCAGSGGLGTPAGSAVPFSPAHGVVAGTRGVSCWIGEPVQSWGSSKSWRSICALRDLRR